jgi:hypothetical protein
MLVPVFTLSLTLLIAVADGVPNWDMTPSCRAAAKAAHAENASERQKACIESEIKRAKSLLPIGRRFLP